MECYEAGQVRFKPFGWCEVNQEHQKTRMGRMQVSDSEKRSFSRAQEHQEVVLKHSPLRETNNRNM
jgi:hypothetical protein